MLVIRRLFGTGTNCIAPSGLPLLLCLFPGLAPWAFLSRPCGASFAPEIDGSWFVTRGQAFEEMDIGLCVKDAVLMVKETRVVQIDRAEYLLGMTLAGRGNQRLAAPAGPGLVQCRILAKTGFVLENQCGFFSGRFFFKVGVRVPLPSMLLRFIGLG